MTERPDPYDLNRFVDAQQGVYERAMAELRAGRKQSHWMWFTFPQFEGLGSSPTSQRYAIKSLDEARAYLDHQTLGPRLIECAETVLALNSDSATDVFGYPDDLKLKSSATLFAVVSGPASVFERLLQKFFNGNHCELTLSLVRSFSS